MPSVAISSTILKLLVGEAFRLPHFDLLHNSHLTVPMYADRCELFVSAALLPSARHQYRCAGVF